MTRDQNIVKLYKTGEFSLRQLAARFGVSHERIRQILKKRDVGINPQYKRLNRSEAAA